jgi:hypothetical protein
LRPVEIRKGAFRPGKPAVGRLMVAARSGPFHSGGQPAHPPEFKAHPGEAHQGRHGHHLGDDRNDAHQPATM